MEESEKKQKEMDCEYKQQEKCITSLLSWATARVTQILHSSIDVHYTPTVKRLHMNDYIKSRPFQGRVVS